jgi:hypothetical protein
MCVGAKPVLVLEQALEELDGSHLYTFEKLCIPIYGHLSMTSSGKFWSST